MFCADELSAAVVAKIVSLGPIEVSEKRFKRNLRDNLLNFLSQRRVYTLKRRQLEPRRKFLFFWEVYKWPLDACLFNVDSTLHAVMHVGMWMNSGRS